LPAELSIAVSSTSIRANEKLLLQHCVADGSSHSWVHLLKTLSSIASSKGSALKPGTYRMDGPSKCRVIALTSPARRTCLKKLPGITDSISFHQLYPNGAASVPHCLWNRKSGSCEIGLPRQATPRSFRWHSAKKPPNGNSGPRLSLSDSSIPWLKTKQSCARRSCPPCCARSSGTPTVVFAMRSCTNWASCTRPAEKAVR